VDLAAHAHVAQRDDHRADRGLAGLALCEEVAKLGVGELVDAAA
jgi:hypothetical protein